ncbi:MAG: hypothetical protein SGCHY_001992 [Lobulomycetales sp.]
MPMKPSFADPLPYIATLGYYHGEIGPQSSERVDHRKDPVYISSQELQRVTIKQAETEAFRRARAEEREALHAASLQRVKNWSNTVEGHRRAKLQQQQSKFDREEAERERIDARFAKEEMELRDEVMNRAHMQRYGERDDVKQFHSKIRLFEALEERDRQRALKNSRKFYDTLGDDDYIKNMELYRRDAIVKEHNDKKKIREKNMSIRGELEVQIGKHRERKKQSRQEALDEQAKLFALDQEFKRKKGKEHKEKREREIALRDTLFLIKEQQRQHKEDIAKQEAEHERDFEYWQSQKQVQTNMIAKIRKERLLEAARIREEISETHRQIVSDKEAQLNTNFVKAAADNSRKDDEKEMKKRREKEQRQEEMNLFFKKYTEENLRKQEQKKQDKEALLASEREVSLNNKQAIQAKKQDTLQKGKTLAAFHLDQINQKKSVREKNSEEESQWCKVIHGNAKKDADEFIQYLSSVREEPWAKQNYRLVSYIDGELQGRRVSVSRRDSESRSRDRPGLDETKNRLGLAI